MSENEKTIDKIRKLMNLGNKTMYKGEAEQAMAAAMRLAAKIGVSLEDIKAEEKNSVIGEFPVYKRKASFALWEMRLALGIAHAIGCELVTVRDYRCYFEIIGTREDAELFDVLHDLIRDSFRRCGSSTRLTTPGDGAITWTTTRDRGISERLRGFGNGRWRFSRVRQRRKSGSSMRSLSRISCRCGRAGSRIT